THPPGRSRPVRQPLLPGSALHGADRLAALRRNAGCGCAGGDGGDGGGGGAGDALGRRAAGVAASPSGASSTPITAPRARLRRFALAALCLLERPPGSLDGRVEVAKKYRNSQNLGNKRDRSQHQPSPLGFFYFYALN